MSELVVTKMFDEIKRPKFYFSRYEECLCCLTVEDKDDNEKIADIKVFAEGDIFKEVESRICKPFGDNNDVFVCFSDLLLKFSGNIKLVRCCNVEEYGHTIIFVFTETKIHFCDVYFDSTIGKHEFKYLAGLENIHFLYMAFNEYRMNEFASKFKKQDLNKVDPELFNEIITGYYGNQRFESNFTLIDGTGYLVPLYVKIQQGCNDLRNAFVYVEKLDNQKTVRISMQNNMPATLDSIDIPKGKIINKDPKWVIVENTIVFLDTLEVFDLSFITPFKDKVSLEHQGYYSKFYIHEINGKKIMLVQLETNRYILWNLNENRPFLYENKDDKIDMICVNDRRDAGYNNWGGKWCPHIFLRSSEMEHISDEEKIYDVFYGFYAGNTQHVTSIGKPYILNCRDGKVVYFVKTYTDENNITGMMFVLDEEYNLLESRENINLISIYDGNAVSGLKFVFFETN